LKKKVYTVVIFILVIFFVHIIIGNITIFINNQKLKKAITSIDADHIKLNEIVPFNWDCVYTFEPYTTKDEIENTLGFKSNAVKETINEGMVQLIFTKDKKIISSICGYGNNLGYIVNFKKTNNNAYNRINYTDDATFTAKNEDKIVKLSYMQ